MKVEAELEVRYLPAEDCGLHPTRGQARKDIFPEPSESLQPRDTLSLDFWPPQLINFCCLKSPCLWSSGMVTLIQTPRPLLILSLRRTLGQRHTPTDPTPTEMGTACKVNHH